MNVNFDSIQQYFDNPPAPEIVELKLPLLKKHGLSWKVLRDDSIDANLSGNKYRKLKYNLIEAASLGHHQLLTFGGAYSNHIYALAAAASQFGFSSVGIIRGELVPGLNIRGELVPGLNPTLRAAEKFGMHLQSMSREDYKARMDADKIRQFQQDYGDFYLVPDGGTNTFAIRGCTELTQYIPDDVDHCTLCCGTGGTMAGFVAGMQGKKHILGFPVLKGGMFLQEHIKSLLMEYQQSVYDNWALIPDYHFGGYARHDIVLVDFMNWFYDHTGIPTDPVYTGKMFYGVYDLIAKGYFKTGSTILSIHSGGLQGNAGFKERFGNILHF